MLNNVWRSSQYSTRTKLKIYQSCVMSTRLYGSECWRMTESDITKLSVFHTKNLRRILQIFWSDTISNQQLLASCNQDSMKTIIMRRRWRWIGPVMRREQDNITRTALHWTPEGKHKRERPRNTWRRTMEAEIKTMQHTWGTIQKLAQNWQTWRFFVVALRAIRHNGHEWVSEWVLFKASNYHRNDCFSCFKGKEAKVNLALLIKRSKRCRVKRFQHKDKYCISQLNYLLSTSSHKVTWS